MEKAVKFKRTWFNSFVLLNPTTPNLRAKQVGQTQDFPGGPVVKTPPSQCRGPGFDPGQGTRSHMPRLRVRMPQLKDSACYKDGSSCVLQLRPYSANK